MKVIFFGNTKYSILGLKIVQKAFSVSLVVTIPGSPVKLLAEDLNIPVLETGKLDKQALAKISPLSPDFLIVEDYGLILPDKLLDMPKYAPLNIHHSLLPKYRGPSPVPTAILNGEKITGVTIIKMGAEVDAGDVLAQKTYGAGSSETTDSLLTKLNKIGAELMIEVIKQYLNKTAKPKKQDPDKATFTKKLLKEDGYFDIQNPPPADKMDRQIRAYFPWPNVWTRWKGKIVKFYPKGFIQMEGKKVISVKDFLNGYPDFPKQILG